MTDHLFLESYVLPRAARRPVLGLFAMAKTMGIQSRFRDTSAHISGDYFGAFLTFFGILLKQTRASRL